MGLKHAQSDGNAKEKKGKPRVRCFSELIARQEANTIAVETAVIV